MLSLYRYEFNAKDDKVKYQGQVNVKILLTIL